MGSVGLLYVLIRWWLADTIATWGDWFKLGAAVIGFLVFSALIGAGIAWWAERIW